jgi:alkylhydroperoxidase family enzyme
MAPMRGTALPRHQEGRHYDERALAALVVSIAAINAWNRLNVTTRQLTGSFTG